MESGNRELGGARDLISQYRLWPYYEIFCKKSLPLSISETPYLRNVVGDTNIRKGEGMELSQLCQNTYVSEKKARLHPFELDVLSEAFHMKVMDPIRLSSVWFLIFLTGFTFDLFLHIKESRIIQTVFKLHVWLICHADMLYTWPEGATKCSSKVGEPI